MFRTRRPTPKDDNYVFILEGAEESLSQKAESLSTESDIETVPTLNVGGLGTLSHQDFIDDFIGSLSKVLKDVDGRIRAKSYASEASCTVLVVEAEQRFFDALKDEQTRSAGALKEAKASFSQLVDDAENRFSHAFKNQQLRCASDLNRVEEGVADGLYEVEAYTTGALKRATEFTANGLKAERARSADALRDAEARFADALKAQEARTAQELKAVEARFTAALKDLADTERASAMRLADAEATAASRLANAEARFAAALKDEQEKVARLTSELSSVSERERLLAFKFACVATDLGGFEGMIKDLGVDEAAAQRWWEEKTAAERREAEAKKARTQAAMEAAARERAEKVRAEREKAERAQAAREAACREKEEAALQALVARFEHFRTDPGAAPRRCHLDSTLYFLVQWCPEAKARFAGRHATVGQVLLFAQAAGLDWDRIQWDVRFTDDSGYNEDAARKGICVRETLVQIRDWALQYLRENPSVVRKTAQLDWYAISRDQYDALKTAERKGTTLMDSTYEGFYSWMWCAQKYVERAACLLVD